MGDLVVVNIIKVNSFDCVVLVKDNEGVINGINLDLDIIFVFNEYIVGDVNSIVIDINNEFLVVVMVVSNMGDKGLIVFYDISGEEF